MPRRAAEPRPLLNLGLIHNVGLNFRKTISFNESDTRRKQHEREGEGTICLQSDLAIVLPAPTAGGHRLRLLDVHGWIQSQGNLPRSHSPRDLETFQQERVSIVLLGRWGMCEEG